MHRLGDIGGVPSVVIDVDLPGTFPRPIPLLHLDHEIFEVRLLLRQSSTGSEKMKGGGTMDEMGVKNEFRRECYITALSWGGQRSEQ